MDILRQISDKRDKRVEDIHLDLPVPTWDGDMIARYDIISRKAVEKFAKQKRSVEADVNFIISATRELYIYDPSQAASGTRMEHNAEYVRLEDEESGMPLKWDKVLAEKLGHPELERAVDVVLYCVKNNALAIGGMAGKLITWMQNTDAEVAEALVGE